jgi:septal ring factor EnvC (AmiA/AmiB activator)
MQNNRQSNRPLNRQVNPALDAQEKPRLKLSRDPNKAMNEMMFTIDRLRGVLIEETTALNDADTKRFLDMQDQKVDIARDYLEGMDQLIARKNEIKQADQDTIKKLEDMREDFGKIAHDNHAALSRMKNGMKRLGERIMETARETAKRDRQFVYGANGCLQSSTGGTIGVSESA